MIKSEYIRNLNCNYERVLLETEVEHKRYQYCILDRGGIRHLLSCNYKCIDGLSYLYYDISSTQNVRQVFSDKCIRREWMKAFFWSVQKMRQELNRFLLDERNVIWSPEHIFQDLEKNDFRYLYIPYYGQEGVNEEGFDRLLEFWVERADYEDEALVEFVYHAYERYMQAGQSYLEKQIFDDFNRVEERPAVSAAKETAPNLQGNLYPELQPELRGNIARSGRMRGNIARPQDINTDKGEVYTGRSETSAAGEEAYPGRDEAHGEPFAERKGLFSFLDGRKRKQDQKNLYRDEMRRMINGYAVCEETEYNSHVEKEAEAEEEYGRTIYIEEKEETTHGLYTEKGEMVIRLEKFPYVLGKRKEDVDYVLSDYSSSRVHARLIKEEEAIYIEDLNSTNGTFKNGLRLQPYEKRKLEPEDTLRFGKSTFVYK